MLAVVTPAASCAVTGVAPVLGPTADARTGLIVGMLPAPLSNGFAPDISWPVRLVRGCMANWAGVAASCSCDIGFSSCWVSELINPSSSSCRKEV